MEVEGEYGDWIPSTSIFSLHILPPPSTTIFSLHFHLLPPYPPSTFIFSFHILPPPSTSIFSLQARIILTMEEKAWRWWRERYLRHIHINCNPSSCYYDDDDTAEDDTSPKLQKITHQIHVNVTFHLSTEVGGTHYVVSPPPPPHTHTHTQSIVSELQDERKEGGGTPRVMEELTNRMEQQEKEMAQVSQHLAEIKNILLALHGGKCRKCLLIGQNP